MCVGDANAIICMLCIPELIIKVMLMMMLGDADEASPFPANGCCFLEIFLISTVLFCYSCLLLGFYVPDASKVRFRWEGVWFFISVVEQLVCSNSILIYTFTAFVEVCRRW